MKEKLLDKLENPGGEIEVADDRGEGEGQLRDKFGVKQRCFGLFQGLLYSPDFRLRCEHH